jgi:FkbM family methyltransferase
MVPLIGDFRSPRGVPLTFYGRDGTSDWNTVNACTTADEYGLRDWRGVGVALDVGAHIGGVTLSLLADNPDLIVVAIEAVPENVAVLRRTLAANDPDYADRCHIYNAAASSSPEPVAIKYGFDGNEVALVHRFIGEIAMEPDVTHNTLHVDPVSLTELVSVFGPIVLMKIDCEGCEWSFLDDPAVKDVAEIRGEWHPRQGHGTARLHELLDATHVVEVESEKDFGPFTAVRLPR